MAAAPTIAGADFFDVAGTPRRSTSLLFVPALLDLIPPTVAESWPSEKLAEQITAKRELWDRLNPDPDHFLFHPHWARARLAAVFGWAPPATSEGRPSLLEVGFLAVTDEGDSLRAEPLVLSDREYDLQLVFGAASESNRRNLIADEFWNLMLADPFDLVSFRTRYAAMTDLDLGDQVAGLDRGGFFDESIHSGADEDESDDRYDPHVVGLAAMSWACPECGGSGEESFFPAGGMCDRCGGSGVDAWSEPWPRPQRSRRCRFRDA